MQVLVFLALIITFANAKYSEKVELFEKSSCAEEPFFNKKLQTGECVQLNKTVSIDELGVYANFPYVKLSGDTVNEAYLFTSIAECEEYGEFFNPEIEIPFIRAPDGEKCFECQKCGNVKSVRFTAEHKANEPTMKEIKEVKANNSATNSATIGSVSMMVIVSAISLASL